MSSSEAKDEMMALVVRSAHSLATRSSLVMRGLRDISAGSQEGYPKSAEDRALELFDEGKFAEAIAICTAGLDANPKDECLWLIKGMCFSEQRKYDELLQCVMPLLEIDGNNPAYWSHVAHVLHRLDRFDEELTYWQKVIQIDPLYEGEWRGIGKCLFSLGRFQEAIEAFDSELKLNSSDDYCQSQKEAAIAAIARQNRESTIRSEDLVPSLVVTLDHWWAEPSPKSHLVDITPRTRSFNFVCKIESISDREQLLGKQMTVLQRGKNADKVYWVADALFVDSDAMPKKIQPKSELIPVVLEVTWLCSTNDKSDADCVREFVSVTEETFGYDDTFETVLQFVWDGE
jgi:tetratricopeptide (TPR) repeat protein